MDTSWSEPTSWSEACRRSSGRRAYNRRRQLAAAVRREVIVKHLRQTGLRHGIQVELSRRLQVSKSTISADIRRLLARPAELIAQARRPGVGHPPPAGRRDRHPEGRMHNMHKKICLRLSSALHRDLQQTARRRHMTPSAFVRTALQQVLEQSTPASMPSRDTE